MEIGNYYWIRETDFKTEWIIKYVGSVKDAICGPCLIVNKERFYPGDEEWGDRKDIGNFRLATTQEIKWLDACINNGEYVEQYLIQDKIINSYSIY